jgi:hypothetical protein
MQPVLSGSAHRFAIFRQPPCFTGRGAGEGRLRATSGLSHGQAGGQSVTPAGPSRIGQPTQSAMLVWSRSGEGHYRKLPSASRGHVVLCHVG